MMVQKTPVATAQARAKSFSVAGTGSWPGSPAHPAGVPLPTAATRAWNNTHNHLYHQVGVPAARDPRLAPALPPPGLGAAEPEARCPRSSCCGAEW